MMRTMRLYKRANAVWYIELSRGKHKSLGTQDEKLARSIYREIQREALKGKLLSLEKVNRIRLSEFTTIYINSRQGKSPKTVTADNLALRLLRDALGDVLTETIDRQKIDKFKRVCAARKVKPVSINGYLRHIKAALRYAEEEEHIKKCPRIVMLPVGEKLPRVLSVEEINALLGKAPGELARYITFLLWTGARRSEAVNLRHSDVKGDYLILRHTKGGKERIVPLLDATKGAIGHGNGYVFARWHPDTLTKQFHALALGCGITARLHDLRHSAATYMLMSDIDIRTVQEILGHASISTTMLYTHVVSDHLKNEMKKLKFG